MGIYISAFVINYLGNEHPAYIWDWGNYYEIFQHYGTLSAEDIHQTAKLIYLSIKSDYYNPSSIIPLLPLHILFGGERIIYIAGLVFLYLLPASLIIYCLILRTLFNSICYQTKTLILLFIVLFPPLWQVSLRGFPDLIGVIPLGIAAILIIDSNYLSKKPLRNAVAIGLLIWIAFLFRRWYAFSGLALLLCLSITHIIRSYLIHRSVFRILPAIIPTMISASIITFAVLIFQYDLMLQILTTSYKDIYQAYQAPILEHILRLHHHAGPVFTALTLIGVVLAFHSRNLHVIFLAAVAITTFLLFSTTQAPSVQHGLPIYLFLFPAATLTIIYISSVLSQFFRSVLLLLALPLLLGIHLVSFSPTAHQRLSAFTPLAPQQTYYPLHLGNYAEYQRLISDLHQNLNPEDRFSVFSSSEVLSDSLLHALDRTLDLHISWVGNIDEVDGFRISSLKSRFAIVVDPTPTHAPPTSQQVIIVPSTMIKNHDGIGQDYQQVLGPYKIDNDHMAYIYERIHPLSIEMIHLMEYALKTSHPTWLWDGNNRIYNP